MGIAKVSNIIKMARNYLLSVEERMLFDWLVVKQEDFGLEKPFRHSISQIMEETGISRHLQNKAFKHFSDIGFLKVGTEYYMNNPYRSFYVDFSILQKPEILSQIVKEGSDTYNDFKEWIEVLTNNQKEKTKPLPKYKQKQIEKETKAENDNMECLYETICDAWKERINMYNDGKLTDGNRPDRTKVYSQIPLGKNGKRLLIKLGKQYENQTIRNGFVAYADKVLTGDIHPQNILLYFLKYEDGCFSVVDDMINYHSMNYSCRSL